MRFPSFTIIAIFIVLTLLGIFLLPKVPLRLKPSRTSNTLSVIFTWQNTPSEIVESQATSPLEGMLSTIRGLTKIISRSGDGFGQIQMTFDKTADMEAIRFEIAALIRQVRPNYPVGMSWPTISTNNTGEEEKTIMAYTLNGNVPPSVLQKFAEENLKPLFGNIRGISNVYVYGATQRELVLTYNQLLLNSLGISKDVLSNALSNHLNSYEIGVAESEKGGDAILPVRLSGFGGEDIRWERIPVLKLSNRIIYLTDLCKIQYKEMQPEGYYRINGLNSINILLSAEKQENELVLGRQIKDIVSGFDLPADYNLLISYDSTNFLQDEIDTIIFRSALSLLILVLFTYFISFSLRYLFIVVTCIFINLIVAFTLYFILGLELQLYSLAGITVSLGIIIDNTFVMIDHVRHQSNKKVFIAILAATLTTIGALTVIFFMEEEHKLILTDFALVLMVNLSVSLGVALFLVPALLDKFPLGKSTISKYHKRRLRWAAIASRIYEKLICLVVKYKKTVVFVAILTFGLPFFLLPERIEKEVWYAEIYNHSFGNEWYKKNIHPFLDTWLGGTSTLFKNNVFNKSYYGEPQRTTLHYKGAMPNGTTVQQMNGVFLELENFLSQFDEIQTFQTRINSPQNAGITIHFKKAYENTWFPYFLKTKLEQRANSMGGLDSQVSGVGPGFSNALNSGYKNSNIYLYGYNYEVLIEEAQKLKNRLLANVRIKEVFINSEISWQDRPLYEYIFDFNNEYLALNNVSLNDSYRIIQEMSAVDVTATQAFVNNEFTNIKLRPLQSSTLDLWGIRELPMKIGNKQLKLSDLAKIEKQRTRNTIYKENQQYRLVLEYDYIGSNNLQERTLIQYIEEANAHLPLGYIAKPYRWSGYSTEAVKKQYMLVFLVVGIIFVLGSILLESLKKAVVVVFMVPISFIGIFLTFYWFELNFDQGGYASFLLLSGLVVNSGFYIINDYNNFRSDKTLLSPLQAYIKAFHHKIWPIILTVISTVAGLIPFLLGGQNDVFWFALAAGTIGGLIFSVLTLLLVLPLFLPTSNLMKEKVI